MMGYGIGAACGTYMLLSGLLADNAPGWMIWFGAALIALSMILPALEF